MEALSYMDIYKRELNRVSIDLYLIPINALKSHANTLQFDPFIRRSV